MTTTHLTEGILGRQGEPVTEIVRPPGAATLYPEYRKRLRSLVER